jgi:hypothetical protein
MLFTETVITTKEFKVQVPKVEVFNSFRCLLEHGASACDLKGSPSRDINGEYVRCGDCIFSRDVYEKLYLLEKHKGE